MSRSVTITKGYSTQVGIKTGRSFYVEGYSHSPNSDTRANKALENIKRVLSPEIDIFTALPVEIYDNERAKSFLNEIRRCLLNWDQDELRGITLPKLRVTEFTAVTIVIEWIFNYFRLYFSFDQKEGDFYGEVMSDTENGKFHNEFRKMELEEFPSIAEAEVAYAVMMAEGGE